MAPATVDPARAAESNLSWILGVLVVFHVIAILFVFLRLYTRIFMVKTFGLDDVLICLSMACAFGGGMVTYAISAFYGLGRHRDTVPKEDYKVYLKMTFIQALVSSIGSLMFLKISIGFSLMRMSQRTWYTRLIWGFISFVIMYSITSYVEWFLVCKPLEGFWDKDLRPTCLPVRIHKAFALMNTSCNILTDIAFATLPIPIIWVLQIARRTRLYLIFILSLGYLAVMVGIVKAVCQNVFRGHPDQSFTNWIQFFGFLQVNLGIIAACAPTLRPLLAGMLHLTTYADRYPNPRNRYPSGQGPNGGLAGSRRRSSGWVKTESHNDDGFEMKERLSGSKGVGGRHMHQTSLSVVVSGSRSNSEDISVPGQALTTGQQQHAGIVRTTVVTVDTEAKDWESRV
jgi:hypothetical protein